MFVFLLSFSFFFYFVTYTDACGNKINNNDEWTHFFRKIYLSHFIQNGCERVAKGLCVRSELETEQTATYWPPVPPSLAALLSHSAGLLNQGFWGPIALCWVLVLSTASYLQLTEPVCGPGLYNCLTPICFLWASHLHPIQPVHSQGYTLISSGCTCSLIDGWVEGQYVTILAFRKNESRIYMAVSYPILSKSAPRFGLVSLFNGISTLVGCLMPKLSL